MSVRSKKDITKDFFRSSEDDINSRRTLYSEYLDSIGRDINKSNEQVPKAMLNALSKNIHKREQGIEIGEIENIVRTLEEKNLIDRGVLISLVEAYASTGQKEKALESLQQLKENNEDKLAAYTSIFIMYSKISDFNSFINLYNNMIERNIIPEENTFYLMIQSLINSNKLSKDTVETIMVNIYEFVYVLNNKPTVDLLKDLFEKINSKVYLVNNIDNNNVCNICNQKVNLIDLESDEKKDILNTIENIAKERKYKGFIEFKEKLSKSKDNVDIILDGANIGYYIGKNPKNPIDFKSLDAIINQFPGKKCLIFLNRRHDKSVPKNWKHQKLIQWCERSEPDDFYWIYAGINCIGGNNKCVVVSNDDMRDHLNSLLTGENIQKLKIENMFKKWKINHIIKYHIDRNSYNVDLKILPNYSVRMQQKIGILYEWHVPFNNNNENDNTQWLCINNNNPGHNPQAEQKNPETDDVNLKQKFEDELQKINKRYDEEFKFLESERQKELKEFKDKFERSNMKGGSSYYNEYIKCKTRYVRLKTDK